MNPFTVCWSEAPSYADRDAYVSDLALSTVWDDIPYADIPQDRFRWLGILWDVQHGGIHTLLYAAGLTQTALASRFGIPLRTVQGWCSNSSNSRRECPKYVLSMLCEILFPHP